MTRTTLHIGTTKTGSSSIQQFLATNRDALQRQGVLYSKALGKVSHNVIPVASKGRLASTDHQRMFKITTENEYRTFVAERRKRLTREIDRAQPGHILISSEHMHSRCFTAAHFSGLKTLLAPALEGRDLQILVYLRPQIEHAISLYSTMLAHGLNQDIDSFIEDRMFGPKRRYHDFRKLIRIWQRAFPQATMTVRAFDAVKTLPEGVISDFTQVTGLDADGLEYLPRVNESLDAWSAEALRRLNAMMPPLPGGDIKKVRNWLRGHGRRGRLLPDPALSRRFQESFAAENDWVMARFLADVPDALEPNWERLTVATPRPEISEGELRGIVDQAMAQ
ncbi:hypothetical protein [Sedimentitalea todarodis]|uniref:Sulfotransferase domain-containing protein n=1 Tax=Sedimentitalea todarodis TaxID=1631240 RepID=A0ABU3VJY8_9RHOB|nr:hypothetical protein [Sedimentitalea todarodis]MDU9006516.1 hypothetical protein [Sedimentitalea todarodis]